MEEGEKVNMATTSGKKRHFQAKDKGKDKIPPHKDIEKDRKCFFCHTKGHQKKNCLKFMKWLEKKGTQFSLVCYESNMVDANHNTWWIDSGSTIHVTNFLQ